MPLEDPKSTPSSEQPRLRSVQCAHPGGLHRMAYTEWGAPDNPSTVICVHGLSRHGRDFDTLAAALAPRHRVVCPDIVGRGRSDWLPSFQGYGFAQYVGDCITLIARLDVEEVLWVGTSMGGLIGMMIAALDQSPIRRFVINDVGPVIGAAGLARIGASVGNRTEFDSHQDGIAWLAANSPTFGPHSAAQWQQLNQHSVVQRDGRWVMHFDPGIAQAARADIARPGPAANLWPIWDRVRCPTLLLRGAESDLLEADVAQAMTERGPKALLRTYPGVGHTPTLMQAGQVADVVNFIDQR